MWKEGDGGPTMWDLAGKSFAIDSSVIELPFDTPEGKKDG